MVYFVRCILTYPLFYLVLQKLYNANNLILYPLVFYNMIEIDNYTAILLPPLNKIINNIILILFTNIIIKNIYFLTRSIHFINWNNLVVCQKNSMSSNRTLCLFVILFNLSVKKLYLSCSRFFAYKYILS